MINATQIHTRKNLTCASDRAPCSTTYNIGARTRDRHIGGKVEHPLPFPRTFQLFPNVFTTKSSVVIKFIVICAKKEKKMSAIKQKKNITLPTKTLSRL